MPSPLTIGALTAGVGGALKGTTSSGGSTNSARSQSYSNTAGREATTSSNWQASTANNTAMNAWRDAARFNAEQARIQREWEERMANTVYQRSVTDMKKAGINPILAAGMGLGTSSVGSGASASVSNPQTFMGQSFAEQNSAMTSESHGSSWNNTESGLAQGLAQMGEAIQAGLNTLSNAKLLDITIGGTTTGEVINDVKSSIGKFANKLSNWFNSRQQGVKNYQNYMKQKPSFEYHNNGL